MDDLRELVLADDYAVSRKFSRVEGGMFNRVAVSVLLTRREGGIIVGYNANSSLILRKLINNSWIIIYICENLSVLFFIN